MKHSWRQHPQRDRKKVRILCEASSTLKMSRTQRTFRWTEVRLDWFSSTTGFYEYRFWGSGLTFDHLLHVVFSLFSSGVWMHLLDLLFYIGGASSPSSLTSSFVPPCYTCVFIPPCLWCFCQTPDDSWQQTCCQTWLFFFSHMSSSRKQDAARRHCFQEETDERMKVRRRMKVPPGESSVSDWKISALDLGS